MLSCQKDKFLLDGEYTYLNCAYMSPNLKAVEQAGLEGVRSKSHPYLLQVGDFFEPVRSVKKAFARLINARQPGRIAIIPSVSYGLANVAQNIEIGDKREILLPGEQFPSNYYVWEQFAAKNGLRLRMVERPEGVMDQSRVWNEQLLDSISEETLLVAIGHVHWTDGTRFDLQHLRTRTREVGALLIVDGTQSIGALPFDVQELDPDALICAGYKWLMGPYSIGLAYYGEYFDGGVPIEDNWINRLYSEDFKNLVHYQAAYQPLAGRFSVGEQSNFILLPMLQTALHHLLEWTPEAIQEYTGRIAQPAIDQLRQMGFRVEPAAGRGHHLFGIRLHSGIDLEHLREELARRKIMVSLRGDAVRVAPHLYNDEADFEQLTECFTLAGQQGVHP